MPKSMSKKMPTARAPRPSKKGKVYVFPDARFPGSWSVVVVTGPTRAGLGSKRQRLQSAYTTEHRSGPTAERAMLTRAKQLATYYGLTHGDIVVSRVPDDHNAVRDRSPFWKGF